MTDDDLLQQKLLPILVSQPLYHCAVEDTDFVIRVQELVVSIVYWCENDL